MNTPTGYTVHGGPDGTDSLTNVERVRFADQYVALDTTGNAGNVAKILGAVFGPSSVSNKQYVGIGLHYIDGGMTYLDLMQLALNARLGNGFSTTQEVTLLFENLLGVSPTQNDLAYWNGTVTSHQYTQLSLAMMAVETSVNTDNIQLAGLAATGLDYVPFG